MSEKVYGIAESKSKVEVPRKSDVYTKDETYPKNRVYNTGETFSAAEVNQIFLSKEDGAPRNHASVADVYGLGTTAKFGHVKLTTSLGAPSGDQDGIALAGSAGYLLKQYIDNAIATASQLPVNAFVFANVKYTAEEFTQLMGYGSWQYCFKKTFEDEETAASYWSAYAYKRIS